MKEKITFSFGKNWQNFLRSLNEESINNARLSLSEFLELANLQGKSFLDIGCGSGLFSYAAFHLGAKKVVSFDLDPFSVECCKYLRGKANNPKNWEIYQGSILDNNFISGLEKFDIVYSWGVLHHTGKMWEAIRNSVSLVSANGYYYIAIYHKVKGIFGSNFWVKLKKIYNSSPKIGKHILEFIYMFTYFAVNLIGLRNPLKKIKNYKSHRGMTWVTDVIDWLGGYPYEFAAPDEIINFMKENFTDFSLVKIKTTDRLSNNWFLFKRSGK